MHAKTRRRILIVEDDQALARGLQDTLEAEGFDVCVAGDITHAVERASVVGPDLILLDLMLPDGSGLDVCRRVRQTADATIIVLTARSQKLDKIECLDAGVDDYLTKPFDMDELLARIRAVLRRARAGIRRLVLGAVVVDFEALTARRGRRDLGLTYREFEILSYLAERPGRTVHRDELLRELWGFAESPFTRSVDTAISRLRKKIESDPHKPRFIHTAHGDGYSLTLERGAEGR